MRVKRGLAISISAATTLALAASPASSGAGGHHRGRILLTGAKIELFSPATGRLRAVATRGNQPAFLPSGKGFVYIREGGCAPAGHGSCFTRYSVFEKSFRQRSAKVRGRRIFGWNAFFVREVDVARDGRLVFSASPGPGPKGTLSIYTSSRTGRHVRRLTHGHFDNDPVVSPDGRRIAFARRVHGRAQIFTIRIRGGGLRQLTHDRGRSRLPDWSPDGRRVVFISQPRGRDAFGRREIYTVGAGGGPERRLTHNRRVEDDPVFSPDGRHIAFLQSQDLWTMGAGGGRPHEVLRGRGYVGFEGGVDWG
jgi:Tol biopolymer transport system component